MGTFRRLYFHLYGNARASRAERILSDLCLLLMLKAATDRHGEPAPVRRFRQMGGDAGSLLLPTLRRHFPAFVGPDTSFALDAPSLREAADALLLPAGERPDLPTRVAHVGRDPTTVAREPGRRIVPPPTPRSRGRLAAAPHQRPVDRADLDLAALLDREHAPVVGHRQRRTGQLERHRPDATPVRQLVQRHLRLFALQRRQARSLAVVRQRSSRTPAGPCATR